MKPNSQPGSVEGAELARVGIFGSLGDLPNACEEKQITT